MSTFGLTDTSTALVIAPHPDDETLGAGGTLARLAQEGIRVYVLALAVPTGTDVRTKEFEAACRTLGVTRHLIASMAPSRPRELVAFLESGTELGLESLAPDLLLIPAGESHHHDHQDAHQAALAAARPRREGSPRIVVGYRGPDDRWPVPREPARISVDIAATQTTKHAALRCYTTQLREPPHPRSLPRIQAIDTAAGAHIGARAAEQFIAYRMAY